jgi:hypothetical protein
MTPLGAYEVADIARIKRLLDKQFPATSKALCDYIDRLASDWIRVMSMLTCAIAEGQALERRALQAEAEVTRLRGELQQWTAIVLTGREPSEAEKELLTHELP